MSQKDILSVYNEIGVVMPRVGYSQHQVANWLELIRKNYETDDSGREGGRCYVKADKLYELGILQEILNPPMRAAILALEPNPVFFHCHAYSIPHSQKENHIGFHDKAGWHRDYIEAGLSENGTRAFSVFIYLTDVNDESNGVFELIPSYLKGDKILGKKSHRFFGPGGHTFIWDRSLYHRPHPNTANSSRVIIKLSIHSNGYKNSRIGLQEFQNLRKFSNSDDVFIRYIAGSSYSENQQFERYSGQTSLVPECLLFRTNRHVMYRPKLSNLLKRAYDKVLK